MGWFSKFFSKKEQLKSKSSDVEIVKQEQQVEATHLKCSTPTAETNEPLQFKQIEHLVPLRYLDESDIKLLPHKVQSFSEQAVIFIHQQPAQYVYYLLEGEITMQPEADSNYEITADSTRAHLPINSGKIFGATAVAKTEVKLLLVDADLTKLWTAKNTEEICCVELVDIDLPEELDNNRFFHSFTEAYRENKLMLPSLPDVAFKLKSAMENDIGTQEAVDIIQLDAVIVAKLIQVANSPLYAPITPIMNCHDAVTRLGLAATRNLVIGISLKQIFSCKDKKLMGAMQDLWRQSLYVSSLCFILAEETTHLNPDDALLAGLVSDIGGIPLLHFAEQYPNECPEVVQLEAAAPYLRAPVGALVLHTLGFPEELAKIPYHSEDWHYDSGEEVTISDIVILAKLHSYFGSKRAGHLPYINTIPAYSKLKAGKLNPDFSLHVLQKANQRIKAVMSVLA